MEMGQRAQDQVFLKLTVNHLHLLYSHRIDPYSPPVHETGQLFSGHCGVTVLAKLSERLVWMTSSPDSSGDRTAKDLLRSMRKGE